MVGISNGGGSAIAGVTRNAAAKVKEGKIAPLTVPLNDSQKSGVSEIIANLKSISDSAIRADKKRINKLIDKLKKGLLDGRLNNDYYGVKADNIISHINKVVVDLKEIIGQKGNIIKQAEQLKASRVRSGVFGEDGLGVLNVGAVDGIRQAAKRPFSNRGLLNSTDHGGNIVGDNVLNGYNGAINNDVIEKVKNFSGDPYFNDPNFTYRKALEIAELNIEMNLRKRIENLESVIDKGDTTQKPGFVENSILDGEESGYNINKVLESFSDLAGKHARAISKKSNASDSLKFQKFQESRDQSLKNLSHVLTEGGIGTSIIDSIEESMKQDTVLDENTFSQILDELNKKRKSDHEGISEDIINEFNELNKKIIAVAKKDSANEDGMYRMRLLQVVLIATLFFAIPFAAPIIGAFAGAIFGGAGIGAGAASLMGASFLGPLGFVGGAIAPVVTTVLTQTPLLGQALGMIDFALSIPALGGAVTSLASFPLVPIAAVYGVGMYNAGNKKHNKEEGEVKKEFKKGLENLDKITKKYAGADTTKNAGGDLADAAKRQEFVEKKYELLKGGHKIAAMTNFVDALNVVCQQKGVSLSEIFSQGLVDYLGNKGLSVVNPIASDKDALKNGVAQLFYDARDGKDNAPALMVELNNKLGLYSYISESSQNIDAEDSVHDLIDLVQEAKSDEKKKASVVNKSNIGAQLYDARYDILYGINNRVPVDEDIREANFSNMNDVQRGKFVQDIVLESKKVKEEVVKGECKLIEESIKSRNVDDALFAGYSGQKGGIPSSVPSNAIAEAIGAPDAKIQPITARV